MANYHWLSLVILSVQVISSLKVHQRSVNKHDKYVQGNSRATVGCVSAKQAETIGEEIAQMLRAAALVETSNELFESVTTVPLIEKCSQSHSSSMNFQRRLDALKNQVTSMGFTIEDRIYRANEQKRKQDELSEKILFVWKKIQRIAQQHQQWFNSLDMFAKDSVLQKAAQIELELNDDTVNDERTLNSIFLELKEELADADQIQNILGETLLSTIDVVVNETKEFFIASQMFTSLRSTKLSDTIMEDNAYLDFYYGYSEVASSKSIRNAVNMRHGTMIAGYTEVIEYADKVNQTLNDLKEAIEKLNTVSETMSCDDRNRIGSEVLTSLETAIADIIPTVMPEAINYLQAVQSHGIDNMLKMLNERELAGALQSLMYTTMPCNAKMTEPQQQAYNGIAKFLQTSYQLKSIHGAYDLLIGMFPQFEITYYSNDCYTKAIVAIGKFIQKCADGEGSFDDIYNGVINDLQIDRSECQRVTGLTFPSKTEVEGIVQRAAEIRGFNFDCTQNKQKDQPTRAFAYYDETGDDDVVKEVLSPTQRFMVCDLRKKSKSTSEIAQLMLLEEAIVESVRCKA